MGRKPKDFTYTVNNTLDTSVLAGITHETEKKENLYTNMNTNQSLHHVVRTISKNNVFTESGDIPMLEAQAYIQNEWLANGFRVLSVNVLDTTPEHWVILWVLVKN